MRTDDEMDGLLREDLAARVPELPPGFDSAVMRRVRPQRLDGRGRVVMAAYVTAAVLAAAWLMRGFDPLVLAAGSAIVLATAAGAAVYVRRLVG